MTQRLSALALVLTLLNLGCAAKPPAVATEGLRTFWATHAALAADAPVDADAWDELFASPGYAALERAERRSAWMPALYEHAYRPSLAASAHDWGELDPIVRGILIPHLRQAAARRDEVDRFVDGWARPETIERALASAQAFLPPGAVDAATAPPVQLVIIDGDGKALPDAVVIDAYGLYCSPDHDALLAHEFHHIFRQRVLRYDFEAVGEEVRPLVRLLSQFEEEGVANLLDKREILLGSDSLPTRTTNHPGLSWAWSRYADALETAGETIESVDALLRRAGGDEADAPSAIRAFTDRTPSFTRHAVGLFMADAIRSHLGSARLIETVGDPFAFMLAYDEAARTANRADSRYPTLSADALARLRQWQRAFAGPARAAAGAS